MKNINFIKIYISFFLFSLIVWSCTKDNEYSENFDIDYPLPVVNSFSPSEQFIGDTIIINGTNLDKTNRVTVGQNNAECAIVSKTANQVVVKLSRNITGPGLVQVYTSYLREAAGADFFTPKYPDTKITGWPEKIIRGQSFFIEAENGDQITAVEFGGVGSVKTEFANGVETGMNVLTESLTLPDEVVLTVSAYGNVIDGVSPPIPVENYDPNASFTPVDPILLWDFEDGVNPVINSVAGAESGINLGTGLPKGRGDNFLTVRNSNVASAWGDLQGEFSIENINLDGFHEPYFTFMVNTNGKNGYMQFSVKQDGVESGVHFKSGNSDVNTDDYNFIPTNGWEWRSVNLSELDYDDWGNGKLAFDKSKPIEKISIQFKQGNGGNFGTDYEVSLDHLMITDGPRNKAPKMVSIWDFEDGVNPATGSAETGINLNPVGFGQGDKYLTVKTASIPGDWTWIASCEKPVSIDMNTWNQPYVSFWVNTGADKCYMQIAFKMLDSEFGFEISPDYAPQETLGDWKFYKVKLETAAASRWSGTDDWNAKGVITNVKLGFTTGSVGAGTPYQINLDEVNVSDSPAW